MKNFISAVSPPELHIHLYDDPSVRNLDLSEISRYLMEKLGPINVDEKESFIKAPEKTAETLARKLASTKVRDLGDPNVTVEPLPGEIEYEKKILTDLTQRSAGVLYDGFKLQRCLRDLIPEGEGDTSHVHVVFTNRLFGTWDRNDRRYHARVSVYGFPSIISTTGIVEAPAKPREFYRLKRQHMPFKMIGVPFEELKEKFKGRFVDYDDERLTKIMKGYVMQAIFYHLTLDPFCDDRRCRLYNAHWQEEVLKAQLEEPELCEKHEKVIERWREKRKLN